MTPDWLAKALRELHPLRVQRWAIVEQVQPAPPPFEFEEALGLGIDVVERLVVLQPQRVGGIQVLEVRDEVRAVELAAAEIDARAGR